MNYLQKLLKINAKKLDFILILILSLLYNLDINNLKTKNHGKIRKISKRNRS